MPSCRTNPLTEKARILAYVYQCTDLVVLARKLDPRKQRQNPAHDLVEIYSGRGNLPNHRHVHYLLG